MIIRISKSKFQTVFETLLIIAMVVIAVLVGFIDESLSVYLYILQLFLMIYYFIIGKLRIILEDGKFFLLFMCVVLFSTMFAQISEGFSLQLLWRTIRIGVTPIIGLCYSAYTSEVDRKKMYCILYYLIMLSIPYGFYEYSIGAAYGHNSRVDSFFGHPIVFGSVLLFAFWLSFYLIKKRVYRGVCIVLLCIGIFRSGARSSWIALLMSLLVYNIIKKRSSSTGITKRDLIWGGGVFVCAIIFLFSNYCTQVILYINSRFFGVMDSVSATQRLGSIAYVISVMFSGWNVISMIFGHGTGSASSLMSQTTISIAGFETTDNQYLTFLYDYGIIGTIFVVALVIALTKSIKEEKFRSERQMLSMGIICGGIFTAFFYELLGWLSISTLILLFIGIFFGIKNSIKDFQVE